jgi:hypothetical protein
MLHAYRMHDELPASLVYCRWYSVQVLERHRNKRSVVVEPRHVHGGLVEYALDAFCLSSRHSGDGGNVTERRPRAAPRGLEKTRAFKTRH